MSTAKFDTLSNLAGSLTVPVATVVQGSAKAWVNFNGTGTVAIRASFNVTSITDNGTGDYTVNFTTALQDANYAITGMAGNWASLYGTVQPYNPAGTLPSTTSFRFQTAGSGWAATDLANTFLAIFR
jgi:hypothetical protein